MSTETAARADGSGSAQERLVGHGGAPAMYAVYSAEQAEITGTDIYLTPEGKEIECTAVGNDEDAGCMFDDLQRLGEVTSWVRTGQKPRDRKWLRFP